MAWFHLSLARRTSLQIQSISRLYPPEITAEGLMLMGNLKQSIVSRGQYKAWTCCRGLVALDLLPSNFRGEHGWYGEVKNSMRT